MEHDPQALADAETYLIHVLESSNPPREASEFNLTAAAEDYNATTGDWNIREADLGTVEGLLARHAR